MGVRVITLTPGRDPIALCLADMDQANLLLDIDHATVLRGDRALLADFSLRVADGEHTAILGPNGSGKSTLVRMIERRLYPLSPSDGRDPVRVFGRARWDVSELRRLIGVVSAELRRDLETVEGLRVREVVLSGFFASLVLGLDHDVTHDMQQAATEALERMGMLALADRDVATLSTGEARRVLIARALVYQPRALLLDEPCTGLDLSARREFLGHLRELAQGGTTLVVVTHHIEEIIPEIGRVVMIRDGRVFADGPKEEILGGDALSRLFDMPLRTQRNEAWYSARGA